MRKRIVCIFTWVMLSFLGYIAQPLYAQSTNLWQGHSFLSAGELISTYQRQVVDAVTNNCYMIMRSGEYILNTAGKANDISQLLQYIPELCLDAPEVIAFVEKEDGGAFADSYFMLLALKSGASFDEARDGISISTRFPERPLNKYDYDKLKQVFSSSNASLQAIYLERMKFMFCHHGCTVEMADLEDIIQKRCVPSKVQKEVLTLYQQYKRIYVGNPAPLSTLYMMDGQSVTTAAYKGRVVVIDVWATWCCSCIEKMPKYIQIQKKYQECQDIVFLSLSIDREDKTDLWKKTIEVQGMQSLINLIAPGSKSSFCGDYFVSGVPRYIIIGRKGEIIDAYASLDNIEQIIQNTLK